MNWTCEPWSSSLWFAVGFTFVQGQPLCHNKSHVSQLVCQRLLFPGVLRLKIADFRLGDLESYIFAAAQKIMYLKASSICLIFSLTFSPGTLRFGIQPVCECGDGTAQK